MPRSLDIRGIGWFASLLLVVGVLSPAVGQDAPEVPPRSGKREFVQLFNGRDLSGWLGHEKYWSVEGNEIVGKNAEPIGVSTYLLTEQKFSDFRLIFDFKLAESEMHSGIAMWGRIAPDRGDPYTYAGHLVMFPSGYGFYDLYGRNMIHQNGTIAKPLGKQHDWNHMEILAQGNRIRFVLNGTLVSDWREPEPDRIKEAPIGLQLHSNKVPQEVRFKNLKLETFPEDKLLTLAAPLAGAAAGGSASAGSAEKLRVYLGTYTGKRSQGIYRSELSLADGTLAPPTLAAEIKNPSFLVVHPNRKFLYAVGEVSDFNGQKSGAVSALAIQDNGDLKLINQEACGGTGPCHITIDGAGKHVLVANYGGGSTAVLPIRDDGGLGAMSGFRQHEGSGATPRQTAPHAHSVNLDPTGRFAMVADLGLDKVLVYRFDSAAGTIVPNEPAFAKLAPGAGPRHFAFHPSGKFAYVINELSLTVTGFAYDAATGRLDELQTIATVPENVDRKGLSTAEVLVHPNGKFLYGSNRGHDTIASFTIDPSGRLTATGHQGTGIKTPRNFNIDPTGRYLLVANQGADSVIVFKIDPANGTLTPTDKTIEVGAPVCIKFVRLD